MTYEMNKFTFAAITDFSDVVEEGEASHVIFFCEGEQVNFERWVVRDRTGWTKEGFIRHAPLGRTVDLSAFGPYAIHCIIHHLRDGEDDIDRLDGLAMLRGSMSEVEVTHHSVVLLRESLKTYARLCMAADQLGMSRLRDRALQKLEQKLADPQCNWDIGDIMLALKVIYGKETPKPPEALHAAVVQALLPKTAELVEDEDFVKGIRDGTFADLLLAITERLSRLEAVGLWGLGF